MTMSHKANKKRTQKEKKAWAPTYDTFLGWWWNDATVERLFHRQLLIKTQKVTITPPHREDFTPEHGQRSLKAETEAIH